MSITNRTTKLLMSAVHLYPDDFKEDLRERLEHPYKSPAPEFGVDLAKIQKELRKAEVNYYRKSTFIFIVTLLVFFVVIQNPEDGWGILIPALVLTSIAEFLYKRSAKKKTRNIMAKEDASTDEELDNNNEHRNIMISGGYSPFVGAGFDLDSWSFTVDINEPDDKQKPVGGVSAIDLHEHIKKNLESLKLDGLKITDELYISGKDVNLVAHLLPNNRWSKPVENIDQQYVLSKINSNDKRERHYRVVRIPMWEGQLILSMHYRFFVVKNSLFSEVRFFLLPPLKKKYLAIDDVPPKPTNREFGESVVQSIFSGTFSWVVVVYKFFGFVLGGFMEENTKKKELRIEVESNRLYNYGWEKSLREKWSSPSYESYFQQIDQDVSLKLLTNEFLASLRNFLSERNISTEQFTQTTTKIVNEGVMISGGEVKAESLAVGKGANIAKNAINSAKSVKGGGSSS